jgi:glucosyl-3-phosphoglycerate phosphatase
MLLVRHAQSEWNRVFGATRVDAAMPDPAITAEGVTQSRLAAEDFTALAPVRIIASPYRRTLQTAVIFAEILQLPITIDPMVRERCAFSCDQGSHPALLRAEWPHLDFSGLEERWWGRTIESMESLARRAEQFLERARTLPDRNRVLVVSHWGFIRCVTGAEVGNLAAVRVAL